ncbi:MAG: hypothetical protein SWH61_00135 [Thermodesulfobacteriota bacterium]|nr:hypothetical protein [Thermodesulfobacteriota bacterium]
MIEIENQYPDSRNIWIIRDLRDDASTIDATPLLSENGETIQPVKEYLISELGYYLLNPNPIMVKKKLIGFESFYPQPATNRIKQKIRGLLSKKRQRHLKDAQLPSQVATGTEPPPLTSLNDAGLKQHLGALYDQLRATEPVLNQLTAIPLHQITDLNGICRDNDGGTSPLLLRGSLAEKRDYISEYLYKDVDVLLNQGAYCTDGLFKLGGFNFQQFSPATAYRLIKRQHQNGYAYLVASPYGKIAYTVENPKLINYLHLFEKCIQSNRELRQSIRNCIDGTATPLHLFFNTRFDVTYSENHMPGLYRRLLSTGGYEMDVDLRVQLMDSLNNRSIKIIFSYRPEAVSRNSDYLAAITVMHDIKALEPLKNTIPGLYTAIRENTMTSEAGRFYLLETMHGRHNEH